MWNTSTKYQYKAVLSAFLMAISRILAYVLYKKLRQSLVDKDCVGENPVPSTNTKQYTMLF